MKCDHCQYGECTGLCGPNTFARMMKAPKPRTRRPRYEQTPVTKALDKLERRARKAETLLRLAIVYLEAALEREQEARRPGIRPEHLRRLRAWRNKDEK